MQRLGEKKSSEVGKLKMKEKREKEENKKYLQNTVN